jgi:hypothetical protein
MKNMTNSRKIPSEQRIETLIANANKRFALILSMMKDIVVY